MEETNIFVLLCKAVYKFSIVMGKICCMLTILAVSTIVYALPLYLLCLLFGIWGNIAFGIVLCIAVCLALIGGAVADDNMSNKEHDEYFSI
jgi:ABC-type transport system involved in multi-copper enzyme maturation permease subunit